MSSLAHRDWQEVVDLQPKGYLEIQNSEAVIHGPIESILIDAFDVVRIKLKWAAKMGTLGTPTFMKWESLPKDIEIVFPNLVVPFVFENTPSKGKRVRFGINILYIDKVAGLDPSLVKGLEVG